MNLLRNRVVITTECKTGEPLYSAGGITVVPQARMTHGRLASISFCRVRPVAVLVQRDGQFQRIPIRDGTTTLRLLLTGLGIGVMLMAWYFTRQEKETSS